MPDSSTPTEGSDSTSITSDSDIYAALSQTRSGTQFQKPKERPELPNLHSEHHAGTPTTNQRGWVSFQEISDTWILGIDRIHGDPVFKLLTPANDADLNNTDICFRITPSDVFVADGHGLRSLNVNEMYWARGSALDRELDQSIPREETPDVIVRDGTVYNSFETLTEAEYITRRVEQTGRETKYIYGRSNSYEAFAPLREDTFCIQEDGYLQMPFTEDTLVRGEMDPEPLLGSQDGLNVTSLYSIDEENYVESENQFEVVNEITQPQ